MWSASRIFTGSALVFYLYQWHCDCLWTYHAYFVCRWYQFVHKWWWFIRYSTYNKYRARKHFPLSLNVKKTHYAILITCHWNDSETMKFFTYESSKILYYSFVYPFFIYVSGNACPTSLKKLVLLQTKIIRIIYGVNLRTSCYHLFEESGFLRFGDFNEYMIARFMYRWYLTDIPDLFYDYFTPVSAVQYHFTKWWSLHSIIQDQTWENMLDLQRSLHLE